MAIRGSLKNGVVVLDDPTGLPEGTRVSVRPLIPNGKSKKRKTSKARKWLKHAGTAKGLPRDAARNLDHYLYGRRKS